MPSVTDLLDTIKDLALVGTGNAEDDNRVMRYINFVYGEVWRRAAKTYPTVLRHTDTVTITAGVSDFYQPHAFLSVRDKNNGFKKLLPARLEDLEDSDPSMSRTGSPTHYYIDEEVVKTWPSNDTVLQVRSIPGFNTLLATDAESEIKLRAEFHDVLIWGPLFYMGYDERDKATGQEANLAQSKYEIGLGDWQSWLNVSQAQGVNRTKVVLGG